MLLTPAELLAQLARTIPNPLPDGEFAELHVRLAYLEEQVAVLRSSDLLAEEPSLPPSLEEQP